MEIGCGYFLDALVALPKDLSLRTNLGFTVQPWEQHGSGLV
jgi:hypothetical protein